MARAAGKAKPPRDPNQPKSPGESIPETGNPATSAAASMKLPGKEMSPKGCRERETGRCGLFRSSGGRTMIQSETDRLLPVKIS